MTPATSLGNVAPLRRGYRLNDLPYLLLHPEPQDASSEDADLLHLPLVSLPDASNNLLNSGLPGGVFQQSIPAVCNYMFRSHSITVPGLRS